MRQLANNHFPWQFKFQTSGHLVFQFLMSDWAQADSGRQRRENTGAGFVCVDAGLGDQLSLPPSTTDDTGLSLYLWASGLSQLRRWAANFFLRARAINAAGSEQSKSSGSRCTRSGVPPGDLQQLFLILSQ